MRTIVMMESTPVDNIGTVEELFLAQSQLKTVDGGYQEMQLETPEWVVDKLSEVTHEITMRVKGELQRRLRAAKARRAALRTPDEKRGQLDSEIAALESQLK